MGQKKFDEAIEFYKQSYLEHNDSKVKDALKAAERSRNAYEAQLYIDPVKAEEHKVAGNKLFQDGAFPAAVKEYDEGLRRDPNSKGLYYNRAFAYIKLMEFPAALKDVDQCLTLDPKHVKAYARKGTCHHLMKEYHKAL